MAGATSRAVAANRRVRGHEAITVGSGEAALTAVETTDPDCVVLDLPEASVVVAVVRGDQVLPGGGSDPLEPGDEVLAVTALDAEPTLRQALGGQAAGSHTPAG